MKQHYIPYTISSTRRSVKARVLIGFSLEMIAAGDNMEVVGSAAIFKSVFTVVTNWNVAYLKTVT